MPHNREGEPQGTERETRTRVLLVEDDAWIRTFLLDVLADAGFATIEAADGRTGLRLARSELPDLVLLDMAMPEFTGADVLAELRRDPGTRDIPVLILSAYTNLREIHRAGAVSGVLSKPVDVSELLEAIRQALQPGTYT